MWNPQNAGVNASSGGYNKETRYIGAGFFVFTCLRVITVRV